MHERQSVVRPKTTSTQTRSHLFQFRPKLRLQVWTVSILAGFAAASPPSDDAFLRLVLERNPSMQAESLTLAGARETRIGANSLLLPQIGIGGDASTYTNFSGANGYSGDGTGRISQILPTGGFLAANALAARTYANRSSTGKTTYDTLGVGVSISQPFLRGFGDGSDTFYTVNQARAAEKVQLYASRSTILAILSESRTAWWKQRSLESVLAAKIQDTTRTCRLLSNARDNFRSGASSLLDTITAFADHLQARSDWLTAWTAARSGAIELGSYLDTSEFWIGNPASDTLAIAPPDSLLREWPSVDSLVHMAELGAPDIAQALALEEKAKSEEIYRRNQTLPTLDAGAFARKSFLPGNANPSGVLFGAQASLNWNIPDGVNRAAARKAVLDLRKAGIASVKARHDLRRTLVKYLDQSRQYATTIALQRQLIEAKKAQLTADEQGYKDGSVSWSDLTAARRDWMSAVASAWSAVASAQEAESDIQSLTGTGPARLGWNWGE
jgi:outer membrane protein TolC